MNRYLITMLRALSCLRWEKFLHATVKNRSVLFLIIFIFSECVSAATIPERLSLRNVLENTDISLGEGDAVFQDSEGFIWLGGSNALVRYDGYNLLELQLEEIENRIGNSPATRNHSPMQNVSQRRKIPVKGVLGFFEDSQRILWIGTRYGLLRYDPIKETLRRFVDDPSIPIKLSTSAVKEIIPLPSGELLACAAYGFFIIDPKTLKYSVFEPDKTKINWLKGERVNSAILGVHDEIWLGTDEGVEKFDRLNNTFTLYKLDTAHPESFQDNRVIHMVEDADGNFWLATNNGLVHFDSKTHQSVRYLKDVKNRFSLAGNDIWKLLVDSQGLLWVGSNGGGISIYDREHDRFIRHQNEPARTDSLSTNQIRTLFEDARGDIWIGLFPLGFNFFDRSSTAITSFARGYDSVNGLSNNYVRAVLEDEKGNLWLGTDGGGLDYFNRSNAEFSHFRNIVEDPTSISGDSVLSLSKDSAGLIWLGFWGAGMASLDPNTQKFTRYPFAPAEKFAERISESATLNSEHVWSIREDQNHDLWIATHTGGLNKYNPKTKLFTHYRHVRGDDESISDDLTWSTLEDSKGNFWIGTGTGLCLMDKQKGTFKNFSINPNVTRGGNSSMVMSVFEDSRYRLWLGTDSGLILFDANTKAVEIINKQSGLIDDTVRTILEDPHGNLWLGTNNGISRFNPETREIKNYGRVGGRPIGGFGLRSGVLSQHGEIILGGVNGLRIVNPVTLTENTHVPPIVMTDFKVFSDDIRVDGADGLLKQSLNHTDAITLDYNRNTFSFEYAALNYRESEKNRYSYKLEGFDDDWVDAGEQRVAKYTNLSPGKFVFRVRGSNNDGVWNDEGKSITIIQLTPPWLTWWAYTIYGLAFAFGLVLLIIKQRKSRQLMEEQNRMLELNVATRTAELREKSKDIQIMLSNIPQGIFTVQNDGLIHPEYSKYLETIFETKDIAHRELSEFLFTGAKIDPESLKLFQSAMFSMIGEDEINFEFNRSKFPDEYEIEIGNTRKVLSLDWNLILENGIVSRLMVCVRDISQLKQMESNLIQSEKLAALGALVAGVSHELNTPIGNGLTVATSLCIACDNILEQMKNGLTKTGLERFLADMNEGSRIVTRNLERASELVSSFKQVAADRTSAQRRKFSLKEIIYEIYLTASPAFKRTPYSVAIDIVQDITLDSYPGPLGQVITNLLNNTIIHAFDGKAKGRVLISAKVAPGGVIISVEDNGVGIPPENLSKIYDPFFTTKLGSGGNGLGMHIVHNIVTVVLGGTITVKSQVDMGTSVSIFLPKVAPVMDASDDVGIFR